MITVTTMKAITKEMPTTFRIIIISGSERSAVLQAPKSRGYPENLFPDDRECQWTSCAREPRRTWDFDSPKAVRVGAVLDLLIAGIIIAVVAIVLLTFYTNLHGGLRYRRCFCPNIRPNTFTTRQAGN
jgi:hypothetical protein